ncbi:MAG: hypothetical protein ABS91_02220 [Thiobacillus sp. SCN 64-35]|nr:MAG: hypothetical protein ABS91_02220 [Thiobacillus sp. SCN 64-35]
MDRIALTGCQAHDALFLRPALEAAGHEVVCMAALATPDDADRLAGCAALSSFVGDRLDAPMLKALAQAGIRLVAQRAAGVDNIDLETARTLGIRVSRVPAYSPESVAEHAAALLLALARNLPQALAQSRHGNFALDGLLGFSLHGKTVGVVGMGRIGRAFARIALGFGCRVLGASEEAFTLPGVERAAIERLWAEADIVSLHCPLVPETRHMVNARVLATIRPGLVLINTARGGVVDASAILDALDDGRLGAYGTDVYENEAGLFFRDCSACGFDDPLLARLLAHPRVLITPHLAFFTREALKEIAASVAGSVNAFYRGDASPDFVV